MLGFVEDLELLCIPVAVEPRDQLILYTDGVLDATRSDERFGEARLLETVRTLGRGDGGADQILAAIDAFREAEQADDIAILSLTREPVAAPRPVG
jgi:serine phosphatase RsbU (regulator of sigma subunit)